MHHSPFEYTLAMGEDYERLAPFALRSSASRGPDYPEPPPAHRNLFQRDRDRIVHSKAFRRLNGKQQVFDQSRASDLSNDHTRTRLTHSIEVAQIARTVCDALRLNSIAAEAMAYAHDLGHAPFGHSGQDELNACMADYGGFEHNLQSLRIVEQLEQYSYDYPGLNLTYEIREGIVKHNPVKDLGSLPPDSPINRFEPHLGCSLEGRISDFCDEIAYNHHDLEDGVRSGILTREQLLVDIPLLSHFAHGDPSPLSFKVALRELLGYFASNLVGYSFAAIKDSGVETLEDVRSCSTPLIGYSPEVYSEFVELKRYLMKNLYLSPPVLTRNQSNRKLLRFLFEHVFAEMQSRSPGEDKRLLARRAADYISGMTDRYAYLSALEYGYAL